MTFLEQVSFKGYLSPTTGREFFRVLLATFEFATYIFVSLPIGKVQNLHPRRGKLKRTRNIIKDFFSRVIKGKFSVVHRK